MRWFRREEPDDDAPEDPSGVPTARAPRQDAAPRDDSGPQDESGPDDAAAPRDEAAPQDDGPRPPARDASLVQPISRERLEATLRRQGYRYRVDPDGSLHGNWDGNLFVIDLVGSTREVLQVRGTWARLLEPDLAPGLAQVVNDWNRDRIWPKVYTRPVGGRIRVHSEVSVDLGPGASDAQVEEVLACGLGTGVQLFTQLSGLIEPETDAGAPGPS